MTDFDSPFDAPGEWLKGNLHNHTTESDGRQSPQELVAAYEERGYDFLALTDHGCVTETDGLARERLVLLRGAECHAPMPTGGTLAHLLALDLPKGFVVPEARNAQTLIDALADAGALVVMAHPYWCGQTSRDLEVLHGYAGIEVFNTTCQVTIGKGTSSVHWDELLCRRRPLLGFAVDDTHKLARDAFGGWIMVRAGDRGKDAILDAIAHGRFYATCGPVIEGITIDGGVVRARTSPAASINFVSNGPQGGHCFHEDGSPITEAEHRPRPAALYIRVEVTDLAGRKAWSNPIFFA